MEVLSQIMPCFLIIGIEGERLGDAIPCGIDRTEMGQRGGEKDQPRCRRL